MTDRPFEIEQDSYRYGPEDVADIDERITFEPVPPREIDDHLDAGEVLATLDIPGYLERGIAPDADTSIVLYRLVQLFGTPNVPGLEAGADQPDRDRTTWQYLFRVTDDAGDGPPEEHLVSVYDHKTNLSVGVSEWHRPEDHPGRVAPEPSLETLPSGEIPPEETLELFVQLVLSTVEHAVAATYEGLHV